MENTHPKSNWRYKYRSWKRQKEREEFAGWSQEDFIDHIFQIRSEFDLLHQKHHELKVKLELEKEIPQPLEKILRAEDFKQQWSYPVKFIFLLTLENRPLKSSEIHNYLLKFDKAYKFYNDPKNTLSVYLRRITRSKRIISVKLPGIKEKYFVMPDWVDHEGKIKKEFDQRLNLFV